MANKHRTSNFELRTSTNATFKVALVCDWLVGTGGAERVVLELHKMFPDAPIYTSQYNQSRAIWHGQNWFADADVHTLWLQRLPKSLRKFLPVLRARAFSKLDLSQYDLVISSSGAEAKAVKTGKNTLHVNYCHAPTHYYWARYEQYLRSPGFGIFNPLARLGLRLLVLPMRRWDKKAAQKPDYMIANSNYTKDQIKKYYGRDSTVIHPPVDVERFKPKAKVIRHGFVAAGRQTPYKGIGLAVDACASLDLPLTVIGDGPEHNKLVDLAGPRTTFLTKATDADMPHHFQRAEAFIFPGVDDFGIVAAEALAAGTPVIAYKAGGALDYVKDGQTGLFFDAPSAEALAEALQKFKHARFNHTKIAHSAAKFSPEEFARQFHKFLNKIYKEQK